jgi:hypothetical protein
MSTFVILVIIVKIQKSLVAIDELLAGANYVLSDVAMTMLLNKCVLFLSEVLFMTVKTILWQ